MFKELRTRLVCLWIAAVIVLAACSVVFGLSVSAGSGGLWLMACVIPPAVMLLVWPSAPPVTIAQFLHAGNGPVKEGRN
jgi:hypothetical protein